MIHKTASLSACAIFLVSIMSISANAADSVDIKVSGTVTAVSCTPTLSGGGTIDYGTMNPNVLSSTGYTVLPAKQLDFTITCDAPAAIGVTVVNGRPNTAAGSTEAATGFGPSPTPANSLINAPAPYVAGLGLAGSAKIGGFALQITPSTVTANTTASGAFPVIGIMSNDGNVNWSADTLGIPLANTARTISWARPATLTPVPFETLNGKLNVQAYINQVSELNLTKPITLDGMVTLELTYL